MGLFLFPIVVRCLPVEKGHEKSVFISFGFLNRAMRLPEEEYEFVEESVIDDVTNILNDNYEKAYGQTAGSYNYHMVSAHLKEIRAQGPLTQYSAYPFEGSYSELRRSFSAGTRKLFLFTEH